MWKRTFCPKKLCAFCCYHYVIIKGEKNGLVHLGFRVEWMKLNLVISSGGFPKGGLQVHFRHVLEQDRVEQFQFGAVAQCHPHSKTRRRQRPDARIVSTDTKSKLKCMSIFEDVNLGQWESSSVSIRIEATYTECKMCRYTWNCFRTYPPPPIVFPCPYPYKLSVVIKHVTMKKIAGGVWKLYAH